MTILLQGLFLLLSLFYFVVILLIINALKRLEYKSPRKSHSISLVIAARNEEKRIIPTLESLQRLTYPPEHYEIIFVDDASSDGTASLIASYCDRNPHWRLITLNEKSHQLRGKKRALKEAIGQAKYDIIFTTDADCQVPEKWLETISAYFDEQTAMVLGHSPLQPAKGFMHRILDFDNLFSALVSAASAKLGFALSSVGRNLAYRKSAFLQVGGFEALKKFRSGDDVHLTERMRTLKSGSIEYCAHPDSFVYTLAPPSGRDIFHQQIRKNSKTLQKSLPAILFSIALFAAFMLFISIPFLKPELLKYWLTIIVTKQLLEFWALTVAARIFRKTYIIPFLPLFQIFYPFYIIFFNILGALQIYEWKK
jgi:poly-beta-1,6-N-acetyl-D-glucosamine synthase